MVDMTIEELTKQVYKLALAVSVLKEVDSSSGSFDVVRALQEEPAPTAFEKWMEGKYPGFEVDDYNWRRCKNAWEASGLHHRIAALDEAAVAAQACFGGESLEMIGNRLMVDGAILALKQQGAGDGK